MRLDPFSARYGSTPMDTWHRLLAGGERVGFDEQLGVWLIVGQDLVRRVLNDPDRFCNAATLVPIAPVPDDVTAILELFYAPPGAVTTDPPVQPRTRAAIRTLIPNTAEQVEQRWGAPIRYRVDQLVDEAAAHGDTATVELVEQFARRLPMLVMLDNIGVPVRHAQSVHRWSDGFADLVWDSSDPIAHLAAAQGLDALWQYCRSLIAYRAAVRVTEHNDDLIAELLRYRAGDDARLTEAEVAAIMLNLIVAGRESTSGALEHAVEFALADPGRWQRLANDEDELAVHVEESLRHSSAINGWLRLTTTELTLGEAPIPAGSRCLLLIGTANHDPAVYAQPRSFDPGRARLSQHLTSGAGPHYCIGAALARLQLRTAQRAFARRFPHLRLVAGHERRFRPNAAVRTHTTLPVTGIAPCPFAAGVAGHGAR